MTPEEAIRALRRLRYDPDRRQRLGIAYVASRSGYSREGLYLAIGRGWVTQRMADRLAPVFSNCVNHSDGHNALPRRDGSPAGRPRLPGPRWPCGKHRRAPLGTQEKPATEEQSKTSMLSEGCPSRPSPSSEEGAAAEPLGAAGGRGRAGRSRGRERPRPGPPPQSAPQKISGGYCQHGVEAFRYCARCAP